MSAEQKERTLGQVIDGLGVTADLEEGDFVVGGVVLLKVLTKDGETLLKVGHGDDTDWIERLGLLRAAEQLIAMGTVGDE